MLDLSYQLLDIRSQISDVRYLSYQMLDLSCQISDVRY